ncbi:hypothetical protein OHA37_03395 [Streptomyces sp. NBC_00335]|uniref:hypothetical protein n=1 Tax=unclassified Streptomyces TaxID=2593676 RepID=UPI00225794B2|nr:MULTISPECIES: hypothetical protein [unclassified Streptomyces]MCX5402929.1 hypothetical protein [Streptomyces sp. NBC_00086]
MLKPTRTILALTAGSLVLGLVGAGTAVAADHSEPRGPVLTAPVKDADEEDDEYGDRDYVRGVVISRGPLTVRSKPTTHSHKVGRVHPHEKLSIECKARGERVDGNNLWYLLEQRDEQESTDEDRKNAMTPKSAKAAKDRDDHWVSARYVKNLGKVHYCRL